MATCWAYRKSFLCVHVHTLFLLLFIHNIIIFIFAAAATAPAKAPAPAPVAAPAAAPAAAAATPADASNVSLPISRALRAGTANRIQVRTAAVPATPQRGEAAVAAINVP
uniref:rRNA-processing protein CGR1 n=1 Tax=Osmia lignaria TaxID=473952 RepID=UPI001478A990|nr:rRNA-processing protein CGR1 [Osmia lignaria]